MTRASLGLSRVRSENILIVAAILHDAGFEFVDVLLDYCVEFLFDLLGLLDCLLGKEDCLPCLFVGTVGSI